MQQGGLKTTETIMCVAGQRRGIKKTKAFMKRDIIVSPLCNTIWKEKTGKKRTAHFPNLCIVGVNKGEEKIRERKKRGSSLTRGSNEAVDHSHSPSPPILSTTLHLPLSWQVALRQKDKLFFRERESDFLLFDEIIKYDGGQWEPVDSLLGAIHSSHGPLS